LRFAYAYFSSQPNARLVLITRQKIGLRRVGAINTTQQWLSGMITRLRDSDPSLPESGAAKSISWPGVFPILLYGVLIEGISKAISFLSDSDVKTCAVFKFGDMEFEVVKANQEVECEGGIAVVIESDGGSRWTYKEDVDSDV